ncbi:MAG TPA: zinc ribbon domain-containing protein [Planctomycetota bacterium]|nr:zinc ribbon domain-containing protein [Planctomycetota bacterium]
MPIYEYEHLKNHGTTCEPVFELMQAMSDPSLTVCPTCGKPVRRIISLSTGKVNKFSKTNLKEKGFTKLVRRDKGVYEKE